MADFFRSVGLVDVDIDEVGNVSGSWNPDGASADPLIVSAHLDTVFPPGTDVTVREDGRRIMGPGISDDGRGLAVMLTVAEA
ncbi:MAG: M28 family peptidase, partial [Actinobacteria bacterium]|nr:M28 family peptidase [Actinomycetota bacterium]